MAIPRSRTSDSGMGLPVRALRFFRNVSVLRMPMGVGPMMVGISNSLCRNSAALAPS